MQKKSGISDKPTELGNLPEFPEVPEVPDNMSSANVAEFKREMANWNREIQEWWRDARAVLDRAQDEVVDLIPDETP